MKQFLPKNTTSGSFNFTVFTTNIFYFFKLSKSFIIFLLILVLSVGSANSVTRTATVSGNWDSTTTWGGLPVPATNDVVVINNLVTVTLNSNTNVLTSLTINSGGILSSTGNYNVNATTITINGYYKNGSTGTISGTMAVGSTGTYEHAIDGGTIPAATWDAASTCLITGAVSSTGLINGYSQTFGNFIWRCPNQSTYIAIGATGGSATTMSVKGDLVVDDTGSKLTPITDFAINQAILTIGGSLIINSKGVYRVCYNLNTEQTVKGNIEIIGGQLLMNSSDTGTNMTGTLNVAGNFAFKSGTINSRSGSTTPINKIIFNGSGGAQLYSSGGTITSSASNNTINFIVNNGAFLQMGTGALPGIISAATTGGISTFSLLSGATLGITSNTGILTSGSTGNIQTNTRNFNAGANYTYNGLINQNIGTAFPTNLTGKLTIDDLGYSVTLDNAKTIGSGGSINLVAGSFANGTNLTMASTSTINRSEGIMLNIPTGAGAYNVNYTGNTKTTGLELAGSGLSNVAVSLITGQILSLDQNHTLNGNVTINTGSTLDLKAYTLNRPTAGGTFTVAGNLLLGGTSGGQSGSNFPTNYSTMTMTGGTVSYNNATSIQTIHSVPVYNNLTLDNPAGVILNASTTVSGTLLEKPNSKLTISPGLCLTANKITNTNFNQIYIQAGTSGGANGSLIFYNSEAVYGTVEMNSIASWDLTNTVAGGKYKWQFFGIPLKLLASTSPTFDGTYVRQMHEDDNPFHWDQLNNLSGLSSFTGYEITQSKAKTYIFQGQLENADYTKTLPYTSGKSYPGQYLIGNPYTAAINISQIGFTGNVVNTVYLYNTGSLSDWTGQVTTDSIDNAIRPGQYTAIPKGHAGEGALPGQIPSMQAFLIKASSTGSTISIPYSSVGVMVPNTVPQRSKGKLTKSSSDKIWTIIDVKGIRFADRMWIFTEPGCTHGFDNGWDGEKFLGSSLAPQLYAMETDGDYQVNSVNDINNTYLGFQAGEDSLYTFTFTHQNLGLQYGNVYLVDSVTQQTVNITTSGTIYTFKSLLTDTIAKRFKIVTNRDITTKLITPDLASSQLKVFSSQHTVFIDNTADEKGSLYLYDMTGRFIQKYEFTAHGVTTFRTALTPGTYLAKGITKKMKVTKKITLF